MAKVLGKSGRYVTQEAVKERLRLLLFGLIVIATLGSIAGFTLSSALPTSWIPSWAKVTLPVVAIVLMLIVWKWAGRKLDTIEKRRMAMSRGAAGEHLVAFKLANFPDEFCVINDLTTPFGNLDHVVIGPTGIYVLDSKNWRGVVSANGNGELLWNGQPTDKALIRPFVGRVMGIKDKVRTLAPGLDPFYQAAFVFTSARVEAKWGSTGSVHCITDDQLHDYIVEKDFGTKLKPSEVQRIAQAFLGLAHMDREFTSSTKSNRSAN